MLSEKFLGNKSSVKNQKSGRKAIHSVANTGPQLKRRQFFATSTADSKGGRGFDPDDISGCMLWLKADSITGHSDAADLTAWSDSSGEGHNVTVPSSASNRPHYKTNIMNGQPAILFTGSNEEYLTTSGIDAMFDEVDFSIFLVVKPTSVSTNDQHMFGGYQSTNWSSIGSAVSNVTSFGINTGEKFQIKGKSTSGDNVVSADSLADNTGYVLSGVYDYSATTMWQFINGTQSDKETAIDIGTSTSKTPTIGAITAAGRGGTSVYREYTGYIAEIIMFNSVLSERNLVDVNHYLGNKYGISVASKTRFG